MTDCFVWDASPLVHAARIDRLDVLLHVAGQSRRHVTTAAVVEEIAAGGGVPPDWIEVLNVDGLRELRLLGPWLQRLSSGARNLGEATVCAQAESLNCVAIIDDRAARAVAAKHGLEVHGVLWVGADAVGTGRVTAVSASAFFDGMSRSGARYPFPLGGFADWAKQEGLL